MKGIPRLIRDFLLAMAVLTFFCWKLDALRTPVVETTAPFSGSLTDASGTETMYDCIVPRQALSRQDNFWYVYVYDPAAETGFPGSATGAAVRLPVLLGHFAAGLVRREWARLHGCLRTRYPAEILRQDCERLVRLLILFVPLILAAALLIRWLWGVGYVLPAGFLPEGSLFAWEEYSRWAAEAFPAGVLSPYAAQLAGTLSLAYGGACALSVLWIFLTVLLTRRAGQGKTARAKAS